MINFSRKQQIKKILGVEICDDGVRYVLAECGGDIHVLYKGMELPAFSFDGVALASRHIVKHALPIRNVSDKEMLNLLYNEMQVSWGLNPSEHRVTWHRPKDNHDVTVGLWENKSFEESLCFVQNLGKEVLALVPVSEGSSSGEEDIYSGALHGIKVACGKEKDLNFALILQNIKTQQIKSQRYLLAAKGLVIIAGIVFAALVFLYGFSCYKVYTLNKILGGMQRAQEQYDWYLTQSGQINALQSIRQQILQRNRFRSELVEYILDAMPEYNNEINVLRTEYLQENKRTSSGIVIEGQVGEIKQLKKFVENLYKTGNFSRVTIGTGKNMENGAMGYTINIKYGDIVNER